MPLIDDTNIADLINSVPGLKERLAAEEEVQGLGVNPTDPPTTLMDQLMARANELYPVNAPTDQERQDLSGYKNRAQRLAPIADATPRSLGSAAIPGNVYSVDTRGAATGVRNAVSSIINGVRQKRRGEFSEDMTRIAKKEQTALKNEESKRAFYEKYYPQFLLEEHKDKRADDKQVHDDTQNALNRVHDYTLAETRAGFNKELEEIRQKNRVLLEKVKKTGGGNNKLSVQLMRDYVSSSTAEIELVQAKLNSLHKIKSDLVGLARWQETAPVKGDGSKMTIDEMIAQESQKFLDLNQQKAKMILELGQVPGSPGTSGTLAPDGIFDYAEIMYDE